MLSDKLENHEQHYLRENKKMLLKNEAIIKKFKDYCHSIGISLDQKDFSYLLPIGIVCEHKNILTKLIPKLSVNKEGLFSWGDLSSFFCIKQISPGYFYTNDFTAMASPVFRKDLHGANVWVPRFVNIFWQLNNPSIDAYIRLDHDRIRVNADDSGYTEEETWYGAQFHDDIAKVKDGATHLRPPTYLNARELGWFFNNAYALDIFWSTRNNIKSFQALEFKGKEITVMLNDKEFHPVRYVHAEYDLEKGEFRHFDGAIQYYTAKEYNIRKDSNFRHNIKDNCKIKPLSEKAFKFNGSISKDMWTEFSCHFFTGNLLIHEYFSGGLPSASDKYFKKIRANRLG